jgi:Putative prokaryotic signal transducing protein
MNVAPRSLHWAIYKSWEELTMSQDEEVVLVRSFGDRFEGELARSILEAAGIQGALFADDAGGAQPAMALANPTRLLVHREDLAEARAVLEDAGLYP